MRPPTYPEDAAAEQIAGTALILATVNEEGKPIDVTVDRSIGDDRLDAAAVAAVEQWEFNPSTCDGKTVKSRAVVPVQFQFDPIPVFSEHSRETAPDTLPIPSLNPIDMLSNLRDDPQIAESERSHQTDSGMTLITFTDPSERSMWHAVQLSAEVEGSDLAWTSLVRLRFSAEGKVLRQSYAHVCDGSASWCAYQLGAFVQLIEKHPPPVPPLPQEIDVR